MSILRFGWYVVLALMALLRMLLALPAMYVLMGAEMVGDKKTAARAEKWVDRIVGT